MLEYIAITFAILGVLSFLFSMLSVFISVITGIYSENMTKCVYGSYIFGGLSICIALPLFVVISVVR
jgi:hypothetical protein